MRVIAEHRPLRPKKLKAMFITFLLLVMAFLGGAVAEKTAHFLQDVTALVPVALDGIKKFLHEQFFIKFDNVAGQFKWAAAITLTIITDPFLTLIRGP